MTESSLNLNKKHISGRLQVTTECNQDCLFCSVPKSPAENPSFNELKIRMKRIEDLGTTDLFISGGEPTLRKDFFKLIDAAKALSFKEITIQSNASNLMRPFLEKIKSYGNVKFNISFHSFEKAVFKRLSSADNYSVFLTALDNIQDLKIHCYLTVVINKLNYRKLKEHIQFIRGRFANITHFSFNFVDPTARANENKWIVPTLTETEPYIHAVVSYIMDSGLTFRLERVPLCYMAGFEEFSTEARMPAFKERRLTYFAKNKSVDSDNLMIEEKQQYYKPQACVDCFLNNLCPGLNYNYAAIHGAKEVYPVFTNPQEIMKKMNDSKRGQNAPDLFGARIGSDLGLFKKAIEKKSNKNNIYDTYAHFLMRGIGLRDKSFVFNAWREFAINVKEGREPDFLSLYIHFPYCQSPCSYCVYPSTKLLDNKQIEDYLDYLKEEMKDYSSLFKGIVFKTLSIGGGTPSLMSEIQLERLIANIYKYFKFDKYGEKSIEFNPHTTTIKKLEVINKFKFNKLSIGVQSFSPKVLKKNNRNYQAIDEIKRVISDFRKTDVGFVNLDLLLGLYGDTPGEFLCSFEEACKMRPNSISVYPIKTNDNYVKEKYGNLSSFLDFYYPLFDKVTGEISSIAYKYGFSAYEDNVKFSYVHPFSFYLQAAPARNVKYPYSNFKSEPYSNLGLGYYAESCLNGLMRYTCVNKNNSNTMFLKKFSTRKSDFMFNVSRFLPNYEKVKFITHSVYKNFAVSRDEYRVMFKSEITRDFPYAVNALLRFQLVTLDKEKLSFNITDEKEVYPYLLFFAGKENVLI